MELRRSAVVAIATAALALTGLSGCGLDAGTNRAYQPGPGAVEHGDISVLNALIVAPKDGSGVLIASVNNATREPVTFDSIDPQTGSDITADPKGVEIAPRASLNLMDDGGIPVTGKFTLGQHVPVVMVFSNGDRVSIDVPVVPNSGEFEGLGDAAAS